MVNMKKHILTMYGIISTVSAEVNQFRFGDAAAWLQDVVGFQTVDTIAAIYDIVYILISLGLVYVGYRWLKGHR